MLRKITTGITSIFFYRMVYIDLPKPIDMTQAKSGGPVIKGLIFVAILFVIAGHQIETTGYDVELGSILFSIGFWVFIWTVILTVLHVLIEKIVAKSKND